MSKTGRNDPCPCGSGKKYKRCCLIKPCSQQTQVVPPFARARLEEQTAFALLLANSEPFRRYYADVRPRLSGFQVVHDPSLPVGVRARITRVNGSKYLRLRTPVCPVEHATLIAHELGHLLQDEQGFPSVGSPTDHPAAAALNSALKDPLVDATLQAYGFDLTFDREAEAKENLRQLNAIRMAPNDPAGRAHWTANFMGHVLDQHVLGEGLASNDFLEWFSKRYPEIADEARKIAAEVISMGFDTPEKMFAALRTARTMLKAGGGVIWNPEMPA